jgi:spore coat polysaccharide biosynthesis predicted glycosyltransferase SpsG
MVAEALSSSGLPIELDIVVGSAASTIGRLRQIAADSTIPMTVTVNAPDIASRMARADLAIGGAGTTSWERCCLGLPTIVIVVAPNQTRNAEELAARGASITAGSAGAVSGEQVVAQVAALLGDRARLRDMSRNAAAICDGRGVERVISAICGGLAHHGL